MYAGGALLLCGRTHLCWIHEHEDNTAVLSYCSFLESSGPAICLKKIIVVLPLITELGPDLRHNFPVIFQFGSVGSIPVQWSGQVISYDHFRAGT